jgi:hypothetical protein
VGSDARDPSPVEGMGSSHPHGLPLAPMHSTERETSDRRDPPAVARPPAFENGPNASTEPRVAEDKPVVGAEGLSYFHLDHLVVGDLSRNMPLHGATSRAQR